MLAITGARLWTEPQPYKELPLLGVLECHLSEHGCLQEAPSLLELMPLCSCVCTINRAGVSCLFTYFLIFWFHAMSGT